jgi:hypothetical protein
MQMDEKSKKEQNGTLFRLVGGTGRGVWGLVGPSGVFTPKSVRVVRKVKEKEWNTPQKVGRVRVRGYTAISASEGS